MGDNDKVGLRHMMPSLFSGLATALTAAAGLIGVLHETGYLGNHSRLRAGIEARARAPMRLRDETGQLAAIDTPAAADLPASGGDARAVVVAAVPGPRNLTGAWRDHLSNCHLIRQTGHELTVTTYAAATGRLRAVGTGTAKGRVIALRMNSANPTSPEADLILSDDGRELSGMMKGVNGAHVANWRFVGPSCS